MKTPLTSFRDLGSCHSRLSKPEMTHPVPQKDDNESASPLLRIMAWWQLRVATVGVDFKGNGFVVGRSSDQFKSMWGTAWL